QILLRFSSWRGPEHDADSNVAETRLDSHFPRALRDSVYCRSVRLLFFSIIDCRNQVNQPENSPRVISDFCDLDVVQSGVWLIVADRSRLCPARPDRCTLFHPYSTSSSRWRGILRAGLWKPHRTDHYATDIPLPALPRLLRW